MQEESLGSISLFFQLLQKQDDAHSAFEIWTRFFPRLLGIANKIIAGRAFPLGAEDAVQEAFIQFFRSVQSGRYKHSLNREDLWRVLCVITIRKSRRQITREYAAKRGKGLVKHVSQSPGFNDMEFRLEDAIEAVSTAEWDLFCSEMLEELSDELRDVAIMRLAGYTNPQIKEVLACSLRSIERRLQIIRATWQPHLQSID